MSQITHSYFGELSTDSMQETDVIWEAAIPLNGRETETWLWADPALQLDAALLDSFAALLQRLPQIDQDARASLVKYLQDDSEFMDFYVDTAQEDDAQGLSTTQELIATAQAAGKEKLDAADFVAAMHIENISLWCSADDAPLVLDYRIDTEGSDQILAVKCNAQGHITEIAWES